MEKFLEKNNFTPLREINLGEEIEVDLSQSKQQVLLDHPVQSDLKFLFNIERKSKITPEREVKDLLVIKADMQRNRHELIQVPPFKSPISKILFSFLMNRKMVMNEETFNFMRRLRVQRKDPELIRIEHAPEINELTDGKIVFLSDISRLSSVEMCKSALIKFTLIDNEENNIPLPIWKK